MPVRALLHPAHEAAPAVTHALRRPAIAGAGGFLHGVHRACRAENARLLARRLVPSRAGFVRLDLLIFAANLLDAVN